MKRLSSLNDNNYFSKPQVTFVLLIFLQSMKLFKKYLRKRLGVNLLRWIFSPVLDDGW
jgi:hypothetical protein